MLCKQGTYRDNFMVYNFDIRNFPEVCETINAIINNGKISEVKVERHDTLTVVEIERKKRIPPRKE